MHTISTALYRKIVANNGQYRTAKYSYSLGYNGTVSRIKRGTKAALIFSRASWETLSVKEEVAR